MKKKILSLLLALCLCLSLGTAAFASGEFPGGSTGGSSTGDSVFTMNGDLVQLEEDDSVYEITSEPTISTDSSGAVVIDGLAMTIHDFTANGVSVTGSNDKVYLRNAAIDKLVSSRVSGGSTAGGYVAGTRGGTLYIQDSVLTEDGRGGTAGNYTVYGNSGVLVVENSRVIQLGEDENGYTSGISEPGSNGGLLVYGYARANMSEGSASTYYFDSYVETEGWAAMSTDSASNTGVHFYSYNSTARAVNGGYGIYADNSCYDYLYGTTLLGAEMGAIIAGNGEIYMYGTSSAPSSVTSLMESTVTSSTDIRSKVVANRTGIMIHDPDQNHSGDSGSASVAVFSASQTDFVMTDDMNKYWQADSFYDGTSWVPDYQDYSAKYDAGVGEYVEFIRGAAILVRSTSATITLDDVTFTLENGNSYGNNAIIMTVINSDENGRWVLSSQSSNIDRIQGTVASISNSTISGDFKNYDYQRKLTVSFNNVNWTGASYTWDAETFNSVWENSGNWILGSGYVTDRTMGTTLSFSNGSVWNVTDTSELESLSWDSSCTINGTVTVDGIEITEAGSYSGDIVVTPNGEYTPGETLPEDPGTSGSDTDTDTGDTGSDAVTDTDTDTGTGDTSSDTSASTGTDTGGTGSDTSTSTGTDTGGTSSDTSASTGTDTGGTGSGSTGDNVAVGGTGSDTTSGEIPGTNDEGGTGDDDTSVAGEDTDNDDGSDSSAADVTPTPTPVPILSETGDHTPGDVNGDGTVNITDVQTLLKFVNGQDVSVVTGATDVSGDGIVNISDVQLLLKYVNGQDVAIC